MRAATPLPNESPTGTAAVREKFSLLLASSLLFPAGAHQDTDHAVVAFMAGGIENHMPVIRRPAHFDGNCPGLAPGLGIVESNVAAQGGRILAREALDGLIGLDIGTAEALRIIGR